MPGKGCNRRVLPTGLGPECHSSAIRAVVVQNAQSTAGCRVATLLGVTQRACYRAHKSPPHAEGEPRISCAAFFSVERWHRTHSVRFVSALSCGCLREGCRAGSVVPDYCGDKTKLIIILYMSHPSLNHCITTMRSTPSSKSPSARCRH